MSLGHSWINNDYCRYCKTWQNWDDRDAGYNMKEPCPKNPSSISLSRNGYGPELALRDNDRLERLDIPTMPGASN